MRKEYKLWWKVDIDTKYNGISYKFTKSLEIAQRKAYDLKKMYGNAVTVKITHYNPETNRYDMEVCK